VIIHRVILQVQLSLLATEPVNKTTAPSDQVTNELIVWNLSTDPLSAEISYGVRKGQNLYFTSPAGGGVCNLIFDLTDFGSGE
jgi:hypothetical protein